MDMQKLAFALQGLGAGLQGQNTAPYVQGAQALSQERKKAMAQDAFTAYQYMQAGQNDKVVSLLENRVNQIKRLNGDPSDTLETLQWARNGQWDKVAQDLGSTVQVAQQTGLLEGPERVGMSGNQVVVQNPDGSYQAQNIEGLDPNALNNETDKQFGSTITLKDDAGNLFTQTQRRNPRTGEVESVVVPMDGSNTRPQGRLQMVSNLGLTPDQVVQFTGEKKSTEQTAGDRAKRDTAVIEAGITSVDALPRIERGLELLERVETGGLTAKSKAVSDFFGTTDADVGELNNILAQGVLDALQNFTGAISEGERAFLERIETNLSQGTAVNKRMLQQSRQLLKRKIDRARRAAERSGDDFALSIFDNPGGMTMAPKKEEPQPTSDGWQVLGIE